MSCISNNFSSFFLDSLNDPSEFAKYLSNAENKVHTIDDIYYYNGSSATNMNGGTCYNSGIVGNNNVSVCDDELPSVYNHENHHHNTNNSTPLSITQLPHPHHQYNQNPQQHHHHHHQQHQQQQQQQQQHQQQQQQQQHQQQQQQQQHHQPQSSQNYHHQQHQQQQQQQHQPHQHQHQNHQHHHDGNSTFDNSSFEFSKYLRHSEYGETTPPTNNLIDLDNSTPPNRSSNSVDLDNFDHDSKHNIIFDVHNSNESSTGTGISSIDQKTSSNTSECSDNSNQANNNCSNSSNNNNYANTRPLYKFAIKDNFDVHPAHKVEEGIFQHMNKLPNKKKETLKQLGVTFTGHMSISDKSIIIDNFARFCEEYGVNDHRPFLTLNQSGMAKTEQIKFARYLGQGLPNFTLFCIYSNFKNLFCTKRFENYIKGNYNLHNILDKTKLFLTCTTNDLKNLTPQQISEGLDSNSTPKKNGSTVKSKKKNSFSNNNMINKLSTLENLSIIENFDVHQSHRIEDGIFTHMSRLSPKKQELLKQFGIQSNHNVTYQEKNIIIENFMKFCNEYCVTDHRAFLDFHDIGLPKIEQIKFARYLGQGLPKLTLYKIYSAFKDLLALNRIDKLITDGYNLEQILKKKKKNLLNRISAIACKERQERATKAAAAAAAAAEAAAQAATQAAILEAQTLQPQVKLERLTS